MNRRKLPVCGVCHGVINDYGRTVTCSTDCAKLLDNAKRDIEKAREVYLEKQNKIDLINKFIYGADL